MAFEVWNVELNGQRYDVCADVEFASGGGISRRVIVYDAASKMVARLGDIAVAAGDRQSVLALIRAKAVSEIASRLADQGQAKARHPVP